MAATGRDVSAARRHIVRQFNAVESLRFKLLLNGSKDMNGLAIVLKGCERFAKQAPALWRKSEPDFPVPNQDVLSTSIAP